MKHRLILSLLAILAVGRFNDVASAASISWTNTAGGDWSEPSNWSPNQVPGAGDIANITAAGTYTVAIGADVTVSELVLGGASGEQTLSLPQDKLTVSVNGTVGNGGVLAAGGGSANAELSGTLTVETGGVLNFEGNGTKTLYGLTLLNQGTVNHVDGRLFADGATAITNESLWDVQAGAQDLVRVQGSTLPSFDNTATGTLRKSGGNGSFRLNTFALNNQGTIEVDDGILELVGASSQWTLGGTVTVAEGALFDIQAGALMDGGVVFGGAGVSRMSGGTLTLEDDVIAGLELAGGMLTLGPLFQGDGEIHSLTLVGAELTGTHVIPDGGQLTLGGSSEFSGTLTVESGGVLTVGDGNSTVDLSGTLTVETGGVLNFEGNGTKTLYGLTLLNQGTVNHVAGRLFADGATAITNESLWDVQAGAQDLVRVQGSTLPSFDNTATGTLRKSGGNGSFRLNTFALNNQGTIEVDDGILELVGASSQWTLGGTVTVAEGALFDIQAGALMDGGVVFGGAGVSRMSGGTLTLEDDVIAGLELAGGMLTLGPLFQGDGEIHSLTLVGAELTGTHVIPDGGQLTLGGSSEFSGTLTVESGGVLTVGDGNSTVDLSGTLTVETGGVLSFEGNGTKTLYGLALLNQGTVNHVAGRLFADGATAITNESLWDVQAGAQDLVRVQGSTLPSFDNTATGTLRKSGGNGSFRLNTFALNNQGTIEVDDGILELVGASSQWTLGGTVTVAEGALFDIQAGALMDGGVVFGGAGVSRMSGGTLTLEDDVIAGLELAGGMLTLGPLFQGDGEIHSLTLVGAELTGTHVIPDGGQLTLGGSSEFSGTLTVESGGVLTVGDGNSTVDLSGTLTVETGGVLNFEGNGTKTLYGLALLNQGTVNDVAGRLFADGATAITNESLWDVQAGAQDLVRVQGSTLPSFDNTATGTLRKSGGNGSFRLNTFALNNQGTIEVDDGILELVGASSQWTLGGTVTVAEGALFDIQAGALMDGGVVFGGAGVSRMSGGTLTLEDDVIAGLELAGGMLTLGPLFQGDGEIHSLTLVGAELTGTHVIPDGGQLTLGGSSEFSGTLTVESGGVLTVGDGNSTVDLSGTLTVETGGVLSFEGNGTKTLYGLTLLNQGTVNHVDGRLFADGATAITNESLWDVQAGAQDLVRVQGSTLPSFDNTATGTLRKSGGNGSFRLNTFALNNQGTIEVDDGILELVGASSQWTLGGTVTVAEGALFDIQAGALMDGGVVFGGAGVSRMSGGTLTLEDDVIAGLELAGGMLTLGPLFQGDGEIHSLTLVGAELTGTHVIPDGGQLTLGGSSEFSGTLTVESGGVLTVGDGNSTVDLSGTLTVETGGVLNFEGNGTKTLYGLALLNQGTVNHVAGRLFADGATAITNESLWDVQAGAQDLVRVQGSTLPSFDNTATGTLRKSGGGGNFRIREFSLSNPGLIEAGAGTLELPGDYENTEGTIRLSGGAIAAVGTLRFSGGELQGTGSYRGLDFLGGTISPGVNGPGRITFPAGLNLGENVLLSVDAVGGTPATEHDQLAVVGSVSITNSTLQFTPNATISIGTELVMIENDGGEPIEGLFDGFVDGTLFDVNQTLFRTWYEKGGGNDFIIERSAEGVILTAVTLNGEGSFVFSGLGTNSVSYTIFASPNVPTNTWENLGTVTTDAGGKFEFTDPEADLFNMRFYQTLGPN